jgi:hypothetical protein
MTTPLNILFIAYIMACSSVEEPSLNPPNQHDFQQLLQEIALPTGIVIPHGIQTPIETEFGTWQLSIQYFEEKKILYLAINDYLWLDNSVTTQSTVFSMTQMLTQNHAMLGGKFQVNPSSGAITIGSELVVLNGFPKKELKKTIDLLIILAKDNFLMLREALGGQRY